MSLVHRSIVVLCLVCLVIAGCETTGRKSRTERAREDLQLLARWLTGSFSSAEQHAARPAEFKDIRLHIVPIWTDRLDGPWLYVEQAAADHLEQPYRQRVYHLVSVPTGGVESVVYELPGDPLRFAGAWRSPQRFAALMPDDLVRREGCSMLMRRVMDDTFVGSTSGTSCTSTLQGAAYATSEASLTAQKLVSWDRGFDATDQQVWGATQGGYVFQKTDP
jgi:hypothetical protein